MPPKFNLGPLVKPLGEQMGKKLGQGMEAALPPIPAVEGAAPAAAIKSFRGAMPDAPPAMPREPMAAPPMEAPPMEAPPTLPPAGGGAEVVSELAETMPRTPTPSEPSWLESLRPTPGGPNRRALNAMYNNPEMVEAFPALQREVVDRTRVKAARAGDTKSLEYKVNRFFERGEFPDTPEELVRVQSRIAKEIRESDAMDDLMSQVVNHFDDSKWKMGGASRDEEYSRLLTKTLGGDAPMFDLFLKHARSAAGGADELIPYRIDMTRGISDDELLRVMRGNRTAGSAFWNSRFKVGPEDYVKTFALDGTEKAGGFAVEVASADAPAGNIAAQAVEFLRQHTQYIPSGGAQHMAVVYTKPPGATSGKLRLCVWQPTEKKLFINRIANRMDNPEYYADNVAIPSGSGTQISMPSASSVRELVAALDAGRVPDTFGGSPVSLGDAAKILSHTREMYIDWKAGLHNAEVDNVLNYAFDS